MVFGDWKLEGQGPTLPHSENVKEVREHKKSNLPPQIPFTDINLFNRLESSLKTHK